MGVMTLLLLLLWAGVTASTVVDLQKRIIGGRDCGPTERLYHVKLIGSNGTHETLCGGSLISDQWILTAEHCWVPPGWTMTAYLGGHPNPANAVPMQIRVHPIYTDNQTRPHDVMLLQLPYLTPIQPVQFPNCSNPLNIGDRVEVAGYASTTMGPNNERQPGRATFLKCVNITTVDCQPLSNCLQRNYPGFYADRLYQHWQCYQSPGVSTSPGDSGGGVVLNGMIYGVHSFSGNATHACVTANGFMDVCEYRDWIVRTTGIAWP